METANIQSVVENNIVSVALMNIQPSSYNPRKHFDEVSLAELAESIRQQGVLQPIGVRPIADTDRFERFFVKFGGNLFFISTVFFFLNPIKSCRYVCFLVTLKTPHH